ncbi:MAG: TVP38/TMEM64 family protein [Solirubrobacterales bacterium]
MNFNNNKNLKIILLIVLVMVLLFLFRHRLFEMRHIITSPKNFKHFILSYGAYSAVVFVLIYSLKPVVMIIPASILSIMAGHIFGPWYGFGLSMIGCIFSATLAFFLANKLGKSFVERHLKGKALQFDSKIEEYGFKIMLLMRLSVVFHYDALSYAAGLSKMKYKDFILGTMLGIIPEMICYSFLAESFEGAKSIKIFLPIIGVALIAFAASRYYKSIKDN